ncbi:MAG TPA: N-formylglutamate amidohydrolase [Dongiaceae bacterium]|nr:N-formylglutamate amidohydrolase [Dongiaceae bacterium]
MQDAQFPANTESLLGPDDPAPFSVFNENGKANLLLFCDHAGRAFPAKLGTLGLGPRELDQHIAWDIGIAGLGRRLSLSLDAPFYMTAYSRLVIDCNRRLHDPTSIPQESDRTPIPGNRGLSQEDRRRRQEEIFTPYHMALETDLQQRLESGAVPVVVSLHSFTPVMNGFQRPWHVGILWNRDARLPVPLMRRLAMEPDLIVGDNEPYSGRDGHGYSIKAHAERKGLAHALFEIRQDLIAEESGQARWADILHRVLTDVLNTPGLHEIRMGEGAA